MGSYKVLICKPAEKELKRISKPDLQRVAVKISSLSVQPRPVGSEKLAGNDRYRIRQGDWRIVYGIDDAAKMVTIIKIGHRREVYR